MTPNEQTAEKAQVQPSRFGSGQITLVCPHGPEVITAPPESRVGRALLAGDYSEESCGTTSCGWTGAVQ